MWFRVALCSYEKLVATTNLRKGRVSVMEKILQIERKFHSLVCCLLQSGSQQAMNQDWSMAQGLGVPEIQDLVLVCLSHSNPSPLCSSLESLQDILRARAISSQVTAL